MLTKNDTALKIYDKPMLQNILANFLNKIGADEIVAELKQEIFK